MFGFVVLLEIVAIVDVLRGGLPIAKKILWSVLVLIVPVVGVVLYFLIGRQDPQVSVQE